jgi:hypothetical protein
VKGVALRELASKALEDSELQAIGTIVVNLTDLDFAAGHLLEGFISGAVAAVMVAGEDIRAKLDKLAVIADAIVSDRRTGEQLPAWADANRVLVDRRNQLMHSFYMTADHDERVTRRRASTRGGKWRRQSGPVDLADLEEFAQRLANGWEAAQHLEEQLQACPEWHGHR